LWTILEADLERMLGAGRTTIGAALVRLDQEGLVQRSPNRGAQDRLVMAPVELNRHRFGGAFPHQVPVFGVGLLVDFRTR
jgi:hypothetical protein